MTPDLIQQMQAINAQVEQHIDYMQEHSHTLPDPGPAMYWLAVLDQAVTVLKTMDCPSQHLQLAVDQALARFDQKTPK